MADFAAPPTPPPPKVPEGWVARWNDQYKEWFYVNTYTKVSQWDKPTEPACPPRPGTDDQQPDGPPPSYKASESKLPAPTDAKHNPYADAGGGYPSAVADESDDAKLARKLQAEEDARARASTQGQGQAQGQGQGQTGPSPFPAQLPPRPTDDRDGANRSRGLLGKLFGGGGGGKRPSQPGAYGAYPGAGYGPQQGGYGPPQQAAYGGGGAYPPQGGYQYPPPGAYYYGGGPAGYPPQRRPGGGGGGGLGMAGGAALGLGAGLLGGALLGEAVEHHDQQIYDQGYENGQDNDYGGGDDYGGGNDFGGDDFGGDF